MPKTLVLITADSLRADHVSYFNSDSPANTPNLDRLAEEGTAFHTAIANGPATVLSVPSLLTGRLYHEVDADTPTLTEGLSAAGYETAAFCTNIQLYGSGLADKELDRGFDTFETVLDSVREKTEFRTEWIVHRIGDRLQRWFGTESRVTELAASVIAELPLPFAQPTPHAEVVTDRAMEWVAGLDPEDPAFVWLFELDTHEPYLPPKSTLKATGLTRSRNEYHGINRKLRYFKSILNEEDVDLLKELYVASVEYWDEQTGRLVEQLEESRDDVTIIITSDHGELFGEHGGVGHPERPWEELLRVPMIAYGDGIPQAEDHSVVQIADVPATLAELGGSSLNGRGDNLFNRSDRKGVLTVCSLTEPRFAYRTDEWKIVQGDNKTRLYDPTDESTDQADDHPAVVARLERKLSDALSGYDLREQTQNNTDKAVKERLRALGYVDEQ
jgi:arylsulfatase A-like enzyme